MKWGRRASDESYIIDSDINVIRDRWNEIKRIVGSSVIYYGDHICGWFSRM